MEDKYWMIPPTTLATNRVRENSRGDTRTRKIFKVKFCNKCNKAWENYWGSCKSNIIYYDDFISYGLKREDCYKCEKTIPQSVLEEKNLLTRLADDKGGEGRVAAKLLSSKIL